MGRTRKSRRRRRRAGKKRHSRTQTGRDLAKCVRTKNRMGPGGGRRRGEGDRTAYGQGRRAAGVVFLSRFVDRPLPAAAEAVRPTDRRRAIFLQATSLGSFSFFANERAPLFSLSVRRTRNALFPPVRPLLRRRKRGAERTAGANLQKFCTLGLARAPPLAPPPPPPPPFAPPSRRPPAALQSPLANFLCLELSLLPLGEGAKGGGGGLWWPWLCAKMGEEREGCAKIKCIARFLEGGGGWLQILLLLLPRAIGLGPDELWQKSYRREGVRSECTRSHSFPLGGTFFGTRFLLMSFLLFSKWAAIY